VKKLDNDASKVWTRNIRLLEEMEKEYGRDEAEKIMKGQRELTQNEIKVLLRRFGTSNLQDNKS
jgi:antitoxin component HigA of HigAB toxin-antitoxin module